MALFPFACERPTDVAELEGTWLKPDCVGFVVVTCVEKALSIRHSTILAGSEIQTCTHSNFLDDALDHHNS